MFEAMGLFLLDQVLENADVFGLLNLDRERLIRLKRRTRLVTKNETVEQEKLRRIGFFRDLKEVRKRNVVTTYQGISLDPRKEQPPHRHSQQG